MSAPLPQRCDEVGECVEAILHRLGRRLVVGAPLAIGKPNALLNELYRRAARDPGLDVTLVTALSLNRPRGRSDLERRFLEPLVARVFGDYPDLEYLAAAREGRLPPNFAVREFYLAPGAWLGVESVQQHYIAVNYSHVARELVALGVNLVVQQVATRVVAGRAEYSLSCNPDVTLDLLPEFDAARAAGRAMLLVGVVNRRLPFMLGDALVPESRFDLLLEHPRYDHDPYGPPNPSLGLPEHAIGVHAAALVRDGGTLQLGIGALSDAVVYALQLRQQRNGVFRAALAALGSEPRSAAAIDELGGRGGFDRGLYGCSELFLDGFLELYRSGVLKRRVYPHARLQRLLDAGSVSERVDAGLLAALAGVAQAGDGVTGGADGEVARDTAADAAADAVACPVVDLLGAGDFEALARCGLFRAGTRFESAGQLRSPSGERVPARFSDPASRAQLAASCLARRLDGGTALHAGFLFGPRGFYGALRELAADDRERFNMTRIGYVNTLYGADYALRIAQRRHARFINTTMMVTLLGAAVSDGLASGQVVSGVGGQHDFVSMAHELPEGRSILLLRATRTQAGRVSSNLVWNYGHTTIPRPLRDVVVTEYGSALLRGRTDRDCVAALLDIADARFQDELLLTAQRAGKIEHGYRIPDAARRNTPAALAGALRPLRAQGCFSEFPFGTDLTAEEVVLEKALRSLAAASATAGGRAATLLRALVTPVDAAPLRSFLARMQLDAPRTLADHFKARLVAQAVAGVLASAAD